MLTEVQHKVQELMREHSKALSTMQTKREHMRQRLAAAEQQRATLEDRIIDLKQQTQDFQSSQASQKKALTNLHQKTAQLQKTLTTARQQALERQKEAQHWQTQHDSAIASLAQARKELQRVGTEANLLRQEVKVQTAQKSRGGAQSQALYDRFVKALKVIIEQQTVTVQQTPDHLMIRVGGEALFRSGQVTLRPESRQILDQIVAVLQTSPRTARQRRGAYRQHPNSGKKSSTVADQLGTFGCAGHCGRPVSTTAGAPIRTSHGEWPRFLSTGGI